MHIYIFGNNALVADLVRQYEGRGDEVERVRLEDAATAELGDCEEAVLLPDNGKAAAEADSEVIGALRVVAQRYDVDKHGGRKLLCHLMLRTDSALHFLQTNDLSEDLRKKVDIYPFTMKEVWSRTIRLDHEPITLQSEQTAHLVVLGAGEMAETVAINAALTAHFPNFVKNRALRTRITIVEENVREGMARMMVRYRHLFDNSYYRLVVPAGTEDAEGGELTAQPAHKPMYAGTSKDFVDVEWEFVEASVRNKHLADKLEQWAQSDRQQLTIVAASDDETRNLEMAKALPEVVRECEIPTYVYVRSEVMSSICDIEKGNLHFFGMEDRGYDVSLPLLEMAKNVHYIYCKMYYDDGDTLGDGLRFAAEIDAAERERLWQKVKMVKRMSNIYNALTVPAKMRSVGLDEGEWERFHDIPKQDIDVLAEVEHNRWNVEELILGYRPCTNKEQEEIEKDIRKKKVYREKKVHYDLRTFSDLRPDETGRSVAIYDYGLSLSLPLIAKCYADEKGGGR